MEVTDLQRFSLDEDRESDKHGEMTHYIFLVYRATYKFGEIQAADDMKKLKWFSKEEIKNLPLTRPSQKLFKELGWI